MNYTCQICSREYHFKDQYNRHIAWCNWLHTTSKQHIQHKDSIEKKFTDSERDKLIRELIYTTEELKREVRSLKTKLYNAEVNKRMKTNEFLNTYVIPSCTYSEWMDDVDVGDEDILYILKYSLFDGIQSILNSKILSEHYESIPIYSNSQRKDVIHAYDTDKHTNVTLWKVLDKKDFAKLISKIVFKVQQYYLKWRNNLPDSQKHNDKNNTAKIMQPITDSASENTKLYNIIYASILKSAEYEQSVIDNEF